MKPVPDGDEGECRAGEVFGVANVPYATLNDAVGQFANVVEPAS
jgi:hypothetical protein